MTTTKFDAYQNVTDQIIAQLEKGVRPWSKSWVGGGDCNTIPLRSTGQEYRGVNVLLLWLQGRSSPHWLTYKQAKSFGGQVRKGEKGTGIVFFKQLDIKDKVTGDPKRIPLLRSYTVFNAEQVDGLPPRFYPAPVAPRNSDERNVEVDEFIAATEAAIAHTDEGKAYYRPSTDQIVMPRLTTFDDVRAYYATLLHELTHWTGHADRCDRPLKNGFRSPEYAKEELIAEIGAAFLCAHLGISAEPREDHASYLQSWLDVLKADKKAIVKAASAAQRAAQFIIDQQPILAKEAA
jgi:antirestriction protein ArdC